MTIERRARGARGISGELPLVSPAAGIRTMAQPGIIEFLVANAKVPI